MNGGAEAGMMFPLGGPISEHRKDPLVRPPPRQEAAGRSSQGPALHAELTALGETPNLPGSAPSTLTRGNGRNASRGCCEHR